MLWAGRSGGIFVSIGAPAIFTDFWEFPLVLPVGWLVVGLAWLADRRSPAYTGDRWLFAWCVTVALWLVLRLPIEYLRIGPYRSLVAYGWTITLVGGVAIATGLCGLLWRTRIASSPAWPRTMVAALVVVFGVSMVQLVATTRENVLYAARDFYGAVRVLGTTEGTTEARQLVHGTTMHGVQVDVLGRPTPPTAYYSPSSGIAVASNTIVRERRWARADGAEGVHFGVVGMGAGTMTGFAGPADRVRFYEISPEVIDIAQGPYFSFVRRSGSEVTVVAGDGRLALERELREGGSQQFDLLAIDAFASDSVPIHLLTVEAFELYAAHLRSDAAVLAVNVTNNYVDLEPVVAANARALRLEAVRIDTDGDPPVVLPSSWILLSRRGALIEHPAVTAAGGRPLGPNEVSFTDRYSNLFRVLKQARPER